MKKKIRILRSLAAIAFRSACILALVGASAWGGAPQTAAAAGARELTLNMDPAHSTIHWTLGSTLHTVHGTFNLKSGVLKFDPATGDAQGEFIAYATSGDSGNDGRDKKMHKEVLESNRYPDIVFRPDKIEGTVARQGASNVQLHGTFFLHGSEHEIKVPVQAELNGDGWKGIAKFSIPYVQWGLKSPNTFLLKADPAVQIELELSGKLETAAVAAR